MERLMSDVDIKQEADDNGDTEPPLKKSRIFDIQDDIQKQSHEFYKNEDKYCYDQNKTSLNVENFHDGYNNEVDYKSFGNNFSDNDELISTSSNTSDIKFEIIHSTGSNGQPKKTLIIFDANYATLCYSYHYNTTKNIFYCNGCNCLPNRVTTSAKIEDKNGDEILKLLRNNHYCEKREYDKELVRLNVELISSPYIIRQPNFKLEPSKKEGGNDTLIIFDPNDATLCHTYYYSVLNKVYYCNGCNINKTSKRKKTSAKIEDKDGEKVVKLSCNNHHKLYLTATLKKNDDKEYVELNRKHICDPKLIEYYHVRRPNFRKHKNGQLFIFASTDSSLGYKYHYNSHHNIYICCNCEKDFNIQISLKYITDNINGDYCRLNSKEHKCNPKSFKPDISELEQPLLPWPKNDEGKGELKKFNDKWRGAYPIGNRFENQTTSTYVITTASPESSDEEKASCISYVGYSGDLNNRLRGHGKDNRAVAKLIEKYGEVWLIPIWEDNAGACFEMEAIIIELSCVGSLQFNLTNDKKGNWKNTTKLFQEISKNPMHPEHAELVLAIKRIIIEKVGTSEMISSRKIFKKINVNSKNM
uniref:GIY-YIG domain-containing protein n=1 Tax=Panagrolaimus sp. ES5 TaxID=591445 RepID=A0AC34GVG2_9BILA